MKTKKTWICFKYSAIAIAFNTAIFNTAMASDISFSGKVTDASNAVYFEGAKVTIKELALSSVTTRDGSFRFDKLPAGKYTIEIRYLDSPTVTKNIIISNESVPEQSFVIGEQVKTIDNIIVKGQRAGQAGAINRQKNADNLMSVVSADTIGQSPDQNAAEALQRLPGMSIQRDQGEGRFVAIRGIDPNLNNVTINGINVPSPEAGTRSVAMDVIPSELIQSLEVSKTVAPDMDANAIGGSVEVKSLSAFDRQGRSYNATFQSSYNELLGDVSPKLSGSFTDIIDLSSSTQLGVASALSWFKRKFGSHNSETDGGWSTFEHEDLATGDDIEVFSAEEIEQRYYEITRERLGIALNFDLHTSFSSQYYLRTLYSKFSDDEFRLRNQYKFDKGVIDLNQYSDSSARFVDAKMGRDTKDRYEEQEILSIVLGGMSQLAHWLVEYDLGYSKSQEEEPNRIDVDFAGEGLLLGYNSTGPLPSLVQGALAHEQSNFAMEEISFENSSAEDKELSLKIDLSRDFVWLNNNGELKFGLKHQSREKFGRVTANIYDKGFNDATAAQFITGEPDFNIGEFGPGIDESALHNFVMSHLSQFEINDLNTMIESQGNTFNSEEKVTAAYAMATLDIDNWRVITGLRYEDTSFNTTGNRVELTTDQINNNETVATSPWIAGQDYDHLLPSLNIKYQASNKLIARFAYTQTIARPTFGDSAAYQLIESEISKESDDVETERKAEVGNPELNPYESKNFDLSVEFYPGNIGVLSAGLFYKDISNYIVQTEVQDSVQWRGFEEVIQPTNGSSASLTGLELAWTKNFASGVFISANSTFVDTDKHLPNQADTIANFMLGYENNDFSTHISTSYKSKSFKFLDNDISVFQDKHIQVDFTAKYYVNDTAQVYFNAINLANEPLYLYHGNSSYNYQYEEYGASFELGFTLNSL